MIRRFPVSPLVLILLCFLTVSVSASSSSLTLNVSDITLDSGKSTQLRAAFTDDISPENILWSADPAGIVYLSAESGRSVAVTALQGGSTVVTASVGTLSARCTVSVTGVSLSASSLTLEANTTAQLRLNCYGAAASVSAWTWQTSNPDAVTLEGSGTGAAVTAVAPGAARITVTGGGYSASCNVTVLRSNAYAEPFVDGALSVASGGLELAYHFESSAAEAGAASGICAVYNTAGKLANLVSLTVPASEISETQTVFIPCDPAGIGGAKLFVFSRAALPLGPALYLTPPNSSDTSPLAFSIGYPIGPESSFDNTSSAVDRCIVQARVMATKTCRLYWALYPAAESQTPSSARFLSGDLPGSIRHGEQFLSASTPATLEITGLPEQSRYALWLWLCATDQSSASNMLRMGVDTPDSSAPFFQAVPAVENIYSTAIDFLCTPSEDVTLYWAAVEHGAIFPAAPSGGGIPSAESAISQIVSGSGAVSHGQVSGTAGRPLQFTADRLQAERAYDIWFIMRDASGNYSEYPSGSPYDASDVTSPRRTCCRTASTLDNIPPSAVQSFTRLSSDGSPHANTDIRITFSEPVRRIATGQAFETLYAAVANAQSDADRLSAQEAFADALRTTVTLMVHRGTTYQAADERTSTGSTDNWTIDYRYAQLETEGSQMILYFPTVNESSGSGSPGALRLDSGTTYHFQISGLADLSDSVNRMPDTALPSFTTVPPQAQLQRLALRASSYPVGVDTIDMAFSVSPASTATSGEDDCWDLYLWSDTSAEYEVYSRSRPADSNLYDTPWHIVRNAERQGGTASVTVPAEFEYAGRSLHYDVEQLKESELSQLNQLRDDRVYEYAIQFLSINGSTNRSAWSTEVHFSVSVVSGLFTDLWNLTANLTPDRFSAAKTAGTVTEISVPDALGFSLVRTFSDTEPPEFISGRPLFSPADTSVTMRLLFNRAATVYYYIAPTDGSLPVYDRAGAEITASRFHEIPTSGGATELVPFTVSAPTVREVAAGTWKDDELGVVWGSASTTTGLANVTVHDLRPETDYLICFALRGNSLSSYSDSVQMFRFSTTKALPPVLSAYVRNPVAVLSANRTVPLDYALVNPAKIPMLSAAFWNNTPSGNIISPYPAYSGISSVLQAMSVNAIDSDASVFDVYATDAYKDQLASYLRSLAADADAVLNIARDVSVPAGQPYSVNCSDFGMVQGTQYALAAVAKDTAGNAFRAAFPLSLPDGDAPMVKSIQNGLKMDGENIVNSTTCSGRATLVFDEALWFYDTAVIPASIHPLDLGPVSSARRASFPEFVGIDMLVSQSGGNVSAVEEESAVGQHANSIVISCNNAQEGDYIEFITNLCDADGNRHSEPLRATVRFRQVRGIIGTDDNGRAVYGMVPTPEIEINSVWKTTAS